MKQLAIVLVVALGCISGARGQQLSEEERKQGFVTMFNGKDFSGWRFADGSSLPDKLPDNWKVEDGVIKLSGGGSPHLGSQWDYEDFDVRFEWRAMKPNYNSGFYIRSGRKVGANQINLAKGAEGGFLGGKLTGAKTVPTLQKPTMEWNFWRVLVVGDKVTFWCNDQLAWEGTDFQAKRGYIGLQAEGAPIEFRNLRIKELGYENLCNRKKWAPDEHWKQEGDTIVGDGQGKPLATLTKDYKNYVFRMEWQANEGATARVALRGNPDSGAVNLGGPDGSGGIGAAKPAKKLDYPAGQWNNLEVRLVDGKATVWLNGAVVAKAVDVKDLPASGAIAIDPQDQKMLIRNLRIRPLE